MPTQVPAPLYFIHAMCKPMPTYVLISATVGKVEREMVYWLVS